MNYYREEVEKQMKTFYQWLSEKDRRRYAAVEATKLGHGGLQYIAQLFGIDSKTIRKGQADLGLAEDPAGERCRKKAVGESESLN